VLASVPAPALATVEFLAPVLGVAHELAQAGVAVHDGFVDCGLVLGQGALFCFVIQVVLTVAIVCSMAVDWVLFGSSHPTATISHYLLWKMMVKVL